MECESLILLGEFNRSLLLVWLSPSHQTDPKDGDGFSSGNDVERSHFYPAVCPRNCYWNLSPRDLQVLDTNYYTYLLTYSMVQSPPWEANWFAASQEIPRISLNPKVHYRTHKRPPTVSILGQPNPVHISTSHLLEIRPNIINPSTPRSPQCSLSLWFPHQDPIHPLSSPILATCTSHLILLDFITRTILGEEYKSFSSPLTLEMFQ